LRWRCAIRLRSAVARRQTQRDIALVHPLRARRMNAVASTVPLERGMLLRRLEPGQRQTFAKNDESADDATKGDRLMAPDARI
jgi:hypothetical protein